MKNIKEKLWDNRGKICLGIGTIVGGYLAYRYLGQDLKHAQKTINKLNDALADTDKYIKNESKIMASVILDMACDYLIDLDESPEMMSSELAFDVLERCKDRVFYDSNAVIKSASDDLKAVIGVMKMNHEIPDGVYGTVEIKHF